MLVHTFVLLSAAFSGAGLVSALSLLTSPSFSLSLSSSCSDALKSVLVSPDSACLNPSGLLSLAIASQGSIADTLNSWLTGVCSSGSCSNDALTAAVTNITVGCASDLASIGVSSINSDDVAAVVEQVYPVLRKISCLKDDSTSQFCVTETIQSVISQLSPTTGLGLDDITSLFTSNATALACTSCAKESYIIATQAFPDIINDAAPQAEALCGTSFTDGSLPDGISQTDAPGVYSVQKAPDSWALSIRPNAFTGLALMTVCFTLFIM